MVKRPDNSRGNAADQEHVKFQIRSEKATRTAIFQPWSKAQRSGSAKNAYAPGPQRREADAALEEILGLARAIALDIIFAESIGLQKPKPSTLFGTGKLEELKAIIHGDDIELVIVNAALSPVQQRNLERAWNVKVLDRTGLILEIFGERAQTREGRLQVDLAHLTYQKSRLVRSWTHLERQRGALGFVGGPGETQIEADRRQIQERIAALQKQLEKVRRTRELHRESRRKVPYPIIALVGYTNAGKSTLFNALTSAEVRAEDLLFATLDPTMRLLELSGGGQCILSDTVGFISDLPVDLVAAFRATLEEVNEADIIVHVRDISHPDTDPQAQDVEQVLTTLNIDDRRMGEIIEVWNKIDLVDDDARASLEAQAERRVDVQIISAVTGEGLEQLTALIAQRLDAKNLERSVTVDGARGADIHWLYENCRVLDRQDHKDGSVTFKISTPLEKAVSLERRFPSTIPESPLKDAI